jgi:glycerophosphoryl diester phosphodiesterase
MMLDQLPIPAIIAHRGASAYAPENTLAAFKLALQQAADAIELDAKLTLDNHVVVIHDQTVDRTTCNHGTVREMTLVEIRKLDAGSHFDIAFQGEPIPTLEEVLKAVGQLTYVNIELTNYATPTDSLPEQVASIVLRNKMQHRVFFSSFNPLALFRIRKLIPEAPISLLALPGWKGFLPRSWLGFLFGYDSLNPEFKDCTKSLLYKVHQRNKKVFSYTINNADDMRELFSWRVDGIFTDDPILARQVLEHTENILQ